MLLVNTHPQVRHDHSQCTHDSESRRDPTRTTRIRRALSAELDRRWRTVKKLIVEVTQEKDLFGVELVNVMLLQPSGKLQAFQSWLDATLAYVVLGNDNGAWLGAWIAEGYTSGVGHAAMSLNRGVEARVTPDMVSVLVAGAISDLRGVTTVVSQQVARAFAMGLIKKQRTNTIARAALERVAKVGVARSRLLADYVIVRAHAEGTLDTMEAAGERMVGVIPEAVRVKIIGDASPRSLKRESLRVHRRERRQRRFSQISIQTAGDDRVCPVCEKISFDGPYDMDVAHGLIPAHPNCRCAFVPVTEEQAGREEIFE